MQINGFFENVLPATVRGASREAAASLTQKSYDFCMKINVFFENVFPAAVRSASRESPLEQKQEQEREREREQEQDLFL